MKPEGATTWGGPFYQTTPWAAQRLRELHAPVGGQVMGLCETYALCRTGVKACRAPRFSCVSTRKSHRHLFTWGWHLQAGRSGRNLWRRRRTETLASSKP